MNDDSSRSPRDSDKHLSEDPVDYSKPFQVEVATRVNRLPPYLFGRINAVLAGKRRAGDDVIDLGMGNPSDPPEDLVIEKLAEAARDVRSHGYSKAQGIDNLRREVARQISQGLRRAARPRRRNNRLFGFQGRI